MAVSKNNVVMEGVSGLIGNKIVFRQRGDATYVSRRPKKSTKPPTEAQLNQRYLFMEATLYAKGAIQNPELKAAYQAKCKGNQSAYNKAFEDFLVAPILHLLDLSKYNGQPGSTISARITDVLAVVTVEITIIKPDGTVVEQGMAVQGAIALDWTYTATAENDELSLSTVLVTMVSTPGNSYTEEFIVP